MAFIKPFMAAKRFTSTAGAGTGTGATFSIAATAFLDDTGVAATAFPTSPVFYNLYVNGIIQAGNTSTSTTTAITIPDGNTLDPSTPILVEFVVN